jgi:hypothetical protein
MAREVRRKLQNMGYQGYRDYYVNEYIRPHDQRRVASNSPTEPRRAGIDPAAKVIVILACVVMCIVVTMMFLIPLQWFFR